MRIILASKSPRRIEILEAVGAIFEVIPANIDESVDENILPHKAVCEISERKARYVANLLSNPKDTLIISADTVVVFDGKIIGKPKDKQHAKEILTLLSGNSHFVYTGFTLYKDGNYFTDYESTKVDFRVLSEEEIDAYIESGEPFDKAGAYGIQEKGALFVSGIHGDYYNVMGLPICRLAEECKNKFGTNIENI